MIRLEYDGHSVLDNSITLEIVECPLCKNLILFNNFQYERCTHCYATLPPVNFMLMFALPRVVYYNDN